MKRVVIVGTFLITASLLVGGLYYPDSPLMWLASTSTGFAVLRSAALIWLAVLLVTHPPRPFYLRALLGAGAVGLLATVIWLTKTYVMQPIDTVVFVEIAIISGIEALEGGVERTIMRPLTRKQKAAA